MSLDLIYSLLLNCSRFFFAGWMVMLLSLSVVVFRRDLN